METEAQELARLVGDRAAPHPGHECDCGWNARAEGLDVMIRQAIDGWYADDHPGIDEDEWREGLTQAIAARFSRPSGEGE